MRTLRVIIAVLLFIAAIPASSKTKIGDLYYELDPINLTAEVAPKGEYEKNENYVSGTLIIPSTVTHKKKQYRVTKIGKEAFFRCKKLTSVTIPNSVTQIGRWAFCNCSDLTSVTIPNSVTQIGEKAFAWGTHLTSINVEPSNIAYSSYNGVLFNKDQTILVVYPGGKKGNYTIPNSVAIIGNGAFIGCKGITSVTIPNSVTQIENSAFVDCNSLTSVTIPNSVTQIGREAFKGCISLATVTVPANTKIGEKAFEGTNGYIRAKAIKPAPAPVKPAEPAKPAPAPVKPAEPAKPAPAPVKPAEPAKPTQPAKSAKPAAKPSTKNKPATKPQSQPARKRKTSIYD